MHATDCSTVIYYTGCYVFIVVDHSANIASPSPHGSTANVANLQKRVSHLTGWIAWGSRINAEHFKLKLSWWGSPDLSQKLVSPITSFFISEAIMIAIERRCGCAAVLPLPLESLRQK